MHRGRSRTGRWASVVGAVVCVVALWVAMDLASTQRPDAATSEELARVAAGEWIAANGDELGKKVKSSLMGTGIWLRELPADALSQTGVESLGCDRVTVLYDISHEKLAGVLRFTVDLRSSAVFGVIGPLVESAQTRGLRAAGSDRVLVEGETLFSRSAFSEGRVRFYGTAASSFFWHLIIAGIGYGFFRFVLNRLGKRADRFVGRLTVLSVALGVAVVGVVSGFSTAHLAGSAGVLLLLAGGWRTLVPPGEEPRT